MSKYDYRIIDGNEDRFEVQDKKAGEADWKFRALLCSPEECLRFIEMMKLMDYVDGHIINRERSDLEDVPYLATQAQQPIDEGKSY